MCTYNIDDPGLCTEGLHKWIYESNNNTCIEFQYGGCWPHYEYETEEECAQNCVEEDE